MEDDIRTLAVSSKVSIVAALDFVREAMVSLQQQMGREKGIVMDGRDIGTTVFPDDELKIFVTASPEIRARRRYAELQAKGEAGSNEETVSPLRKADDAIELDNSHMTNSEQKEWLAAQFRKATEAE